MSVRQLGGVGEGVVVLLWRVARWSAGVDLCLVEDIPICLELHLRGEFLEGLEGVHDLIIEHKFYNYKPFQFIRELYAC